MCEPVSISAGIAAAATLIGAGVSYMGAQQQASAQRDAATQNANAQAGAAAYQAAVDRNNQTIANQRATDAEQRGQVAEEQKRQQTAALEARQRTTLAANGVLVDTGSALDLTADTAGQGEQDALTIRSNAAREAYGYRTQGLNFASDAGLADMKGQSALAAGNIAADAATTAGNYNAASSLISGVGSVSKQWYNMSYGTGTKGGGLV